jgi:hypothetical protein
LLSEGVTRELMRKPPCVIEEGLLGEEEVVVENGVEAEVEACNDN